MRRALLAMVLGLVTVFAALGFAVRSPRVQQKILQELRQIVQNKTGLVLDVKELEISLVPTHVSINTFTLVDPDAVGAPFLTVQHGSVSIAWLQTLRLRRLAFGDLELIGIHAPLIDLQDPRWHSKTTTSAQPAPLQEPPPFASIALRDIDATVLSNDVRLALHNANVVLETQNRDQRHLQVVIEQAKLNASQRVLRFATAINLELLGPLLQPTSLSVESVNIVVDGITAQVIGTLTLQPTLEVFATATLDARLDQLKQYLPTLPSLHGKAHVALDAHGPLLHPQIRAGVKLDNFRLVDRLLGDIDLEAVYEDKQLVLEQFKLKHPTMGMLTGSGTADLESEHKTFTFAARAHDLRLPEILALSGLPDAWVELTVNGDVHGSGQLSPLNLESKVDFVTSDLRVRDRSYRSSEFRTFLEIPKLSIKGPLHLDNQAVHLDGIAIARNDTAIDVTGELYLNPKLGMNLTLLATRLDMLDLGPVADINFTGLGTLSANVVGAYQHPVISGEATIEAFSLLTYYLGDLTSKFRYEGITLALTQAMLQRDEGNVHGDLRLTFGKTELGSHGRFILQKVDLADLMFSLGLAPTTAQRFSAEVTGRVEVEGPLQRPRGHLVLSSPQLYIDNVGFGPLEVEGGFDNGQSLLSIKGRLRPQSGTLAGEFAVQTDKSIALHFRGNDVPMSLITPFIGDIPLSGSLTAEADLRGALQALSGSVTMTARDFVAYGVKLETTTLSGTATEGQFEATAQLLSGAINGDLTLSLGGKLPFYAMAHFNQLDLGRMQALPSGVEIWVSGTASAKGDLASPETLEATLEIPDTTVKWRQLVMQNSSPVVLNYVNRRLHIANMTLIGPTIDLRMQGDIPTTGDLDLHVVSSGDLGTLSLLAGALQQNQGDFSLRLAVGGTIDHPVVDGEGHIKNGLLRYSETDLPLENLQADVLFAGRNVAVTKGSATLGGGTLTFSGEGVLPQAKNPAELSLRSHLNSVRLHPIADTDVTLSGDLSMTGPSSDMLLKGALKIEALRYTANLDLERLIPKRNVPPLHVPAMDPGKAVRLAIKVEAPKNILISNNVLEAEMRADLLITGTTERLGVVGSVTPIWAKVRYRDNIFSVTRASIDFVDEYRIFTQFAVEAKVDACNMQVNVSIQGDSENYNIVPTGRDQTGLVDPQDVLICLQFGLRKSDFDGKQAAPTSISDALQAGGLDALWTVSGIDQRIRRLLPIDVNEIRLTSAWSSVAKRTTPRLVVGKELGKNVALRYSRALNAYNDQSLSLEYRLANMATMQGSWMSTTMVPVGDFGVDLRLHWEFR